MSEQRVFISYSSDDRPLVPAALKWMRDSELRSAKIDDPAAWSAAGDDVRTIITDKIRHADTMLLVWSDRAAKSAWVQYEVGMAQAFGVPIRVLVASGSRAKLPTGLSKTSVVTVDPVQPDSDAVAHSPKAGPSVSTALEGLNLQYQRIEEQIQQMHAMLGGISSTAARKRSAATQKRRNAGDRKRNGES